MSQGGLAWIQATSDEIRGGVSRPRGQAAAGSSTPLVPHTGTQGLREGNRAGSDSILASPCFLFTFPWPHTADRQLSGEPGEESQCSWESGRQGKDWVSIYPTQRPQLTLGLLRRQVTHTGPELTLGLKTCAAAKCSGTKRASPAATLSLAPFSWALWLSHPPSSSSAFFPHPLFPISPLVSFLLYFFLPFFSVLPAHSLFLPPLSFLCMCTMTSRSLCVLGIIFQ